MLVSQLANAAMMGAFREGVKIDIASTRDQTEFMEFSGSERYVFVQKCERMLHVEV